MLQFSGTALQMIPKQEMIPNCKWSPNRRSSPTTNNPRCRPQMIPHAGNVLRVEFSIFNLNRNKSKLTIFYLWKRKHRPSFCRCLKTSVKVWENEKCWGTRAAGECFHRFSESSKTFTYFCKLKETWRTCFLFLLQDALKKKGIQVVNLDSLLAPSFRQRLFLFWVYIELHKDGFKPISARL